MHRFTTADAPLSYRRYTALLQQMHRFTTADAPHYYSKCTALLQQMHRFTTADSPLYCKHLAKELHLEERRHTIVEERTLRAHLHIRP
jgi:hypothetical protein